MSFDVAGDEVAANALANGKGLVIVVRPDAHAVFALHADGCDHATVAVMLGAAMATLKSNTKLLGEQVPMTLDEWLDLILATARSLEAHRSPRDTTILTARTEPCPDSGAKP